MYNPFKKKVKKTPEQMAEETMIMQLGLLMKGTKENATPEEKKQISERLKEHARTQGAELLKEAFKIGMLTKAEWADLQEKGLDIIDMNGILLGEFTKQSEMQKVIILTAKGSPAFKNRKFLEERFSIRIKTGEEVQAEMLKEKRRTTANYFG